MAEKQMAMSLYLAQPNTKKYLQSVLGERTGQFITSLTSLASSSEALKKCTRNSLMGCAIKAAAMDLSIDPALGFAWAIPYGNVASFQMGAKGFVQLAMRTGQYKSLGVRDVREGEFAGRNFVGDPEINWLSDDERIDKPIIGYMAGMELTNGFRKVIFWTKKEVEKHAEKYSQGFRYFKAHGASQSSSRSGNHESPWASDFDKMAEKTVLKALISKYGIMSTEIQNAVKYDQAAINIDTDTGEESVEYVDNEPEPVAKPLSGEQQAALLKKYGADKVQQALKLGGYATLNEVTDETVEELVKVIEGLK